MTHTFDITIKTNKKNNPSINNRASKALDNLISSSIKNMLGFGEEKKENFSFSYTPKKKSPKKTIDIDIYIPRKKTTAKKPNITTFTEALMYLMGMDKMDTYDFKLADGTPVKFFNDEIQIGYDLYTIENGIAELNDRMSDANKKKIIDIYINL